MEGQKKYRLLDKIAVGGMAEIWLAKWVGANGFERLVVIKKMLENLMSDETFVLMFQDEGILAGHFNHPNIAQVYELGSEDNAFYMAMEYIQGVDLREVLLKTYELQEELPVHYAVKIISDAAKGLHYAHTLTDLGNKPLHIIHRDVSPQNILVTYDGEVKLIDFGIAKTETQTQKTKTGILKGKFAYMSPEQVRMKKIDHRTDIFALGVVLYEITLNIRLFKADSEIETLRNVVNQPIKPPIEVNPEYPEILSKIIMKALAKNPDRRFQTAKSFSIALETFLKHYPKPAFSAYISDWLSKLFENRIATEYERRKNLSILDRYNRLQEMPEQTRQTPKNLPLVEEKTVAFMPDQAKEELLEDTIIHQNNAPPMEDKFDDITTIEKKSEHQKKQLKKAGKIQKFEENRDKLKNLPEEVWGDMADIYEEEDLYTEIRTSKKEQGSKKNTFSKLISNIIYISIIAGILLTANTNYTRYKQANSIVETWFKQITPDHNFQENFPQVAADFCRKEKLISCHRNSIRITPRENVYSVFMSYSIQGSFFGLFSVSVGSSHHGFKDIPKKPTIVDPPEKKVIKHKNHTHQKVPPKK